MTNIAPPPVTLVDNPHAPNVFADSVVGWYLLNGNIRMTFEATHATHTSSPGPINRVVIGRLVMPMDRAEEMANGLLDFIKQMKAQAATPSSATGSATVN
jgi:hypothetical protein